MAAVVKRLDLTAGFTGVVRSDAADRRPGCRRAPPSRWRRPWRSAAAGPTASPWRCCCRDAEHEARGVPTGLLDQLASILGVAGHALLLDCSTNTVTPAPLPSPDEAEVVVVDAGARDRWRRTRLRRPGTTSASSAEAEIGPLRSAAPADVERLVDPVIRRRARHVVTENAASTSSPPPSAAGDLRRRRAIMNASHRSLRVDYESSTPAIDALCDELRSTAGRLRGADHRRWLGRMRGCSGQAPESLAGHGWTVRAVDGASVEIREHRERDR